jgi:hypothetical protein
VFLGQLHLLLRKVKIILQTDPKVMLLKGLLSIKKWMNYLVILKKKKKLKKIQKAQKEIDHKKKKNQ